LISVLIVDDHDLIREGLRRAFEREDDFEVIGEAGTIDEAFRQVGVITPDVVIMDVRLPGGSGLEATKKLRSSNQRLGIVILTMYAGDDQLFEALDAGASAFVPKNAQSADVVAAARHAATTPNSFSAPDLAEALRRRMAPQGPQLSPRETEVLGRLAEGLSVAQISRTLYISESTTKTHISKLYDKLGVANRAQALMTALRLGLIARDGSPVD
jgi:DNA-binding NarL/FixJ family response regulator